ncbi:NUDIX domain-containing protein [Amycolatopsis minnesotensis]|uniref:NUDIX domain-containing protein n=1 Tax=Amycolatopsis minnesotensis TaxID=337894 RepID=A0ABN2R9T6_9PSEU
MARGDGEGFVRCACGQRHWGRYGAAGLLLTDPERGVLLQRRAWWTHQGRTWGVPGGALRSGESPLDAARREAAEEAAVPPDLLVPTASSTVDHGTWHYTTVLATARARVRAEVSDVESAELRWVPPEEVPSLRLHPGFAEAWPSLAGELDRALVLVVDAANVMGSRPDGWWRDRAGAAARLRDRLAGLVTAGVPDSAAGLLGRPGWRWWPRIVLVVEGQARGVSAVDGVPVVAAPRDGDAEIVAQARRLVEERPYDHVLVATADRELRDRITAEGAGPMSPRTLLSLLD